MRLNWKRYTIGTVMLASLSLMLWGCGGGGGDESQSVASNVSKLIAGTVSDITTNRPLSGAKITAYAILDGVENSGITLSETVTSGSDGSYALHIPTSYTGPLVVKAIPQSSTVARLLKAVFASQSPPALLRALVAKNIVDKSSLPPININYATEMVALFIEQNVINAATPANGFTGSGFSTENIQRATIALETFFGPGFISMELPKSPTDITTTKQQQDLLVSIAAIQKMIADPATGVTLDVLVVKLTAPTGLGIIADSLKQAIISVTAVLQTEGTLPKEYIPSTFINTAISNVQTAPVVFVAETLNDTIAPTVPTNLNVTVTNPRTVSLSWNSSSDAGGIGGYQILRADASGIFKTIDTVPGVIGTSVSYLDALVAPASVYEYKVVAFDIARNFSDASAAFIVTTPALPVLADTIAPTTPAALISIGTTDAQVNLQWGASTDRNSDGSVAAASGYLLYRNAQIIATVTDTSYIDKTVSPATEYTYYVKSFDAVSNNSAASTPLTIRTQNKASTTPPNAPATLSVISNAYNKVLLQWTPSTTAAVTYTVYRGADIIVSGITSTQYSDVSVVPNSTYNYSVSAVSVTGESGKSSLSVTVPGSPVAIQTAPSIPQNFAALSVTSGSVALTWAASIKTDGDGSVAGYDILRNGIVIATVKTPGYTDSSVVPSTKDVISTYNYTVKSFSSTGERSGSSSTVPAIIPPAADLTDITAPGVPTNLSLKSAATSSLVELVWTAPSDTDIVGYKIFRDGVYLSASVDSIYMDGTVTGGNTYMYTVKAYDGAGNISAAGNILQVSTPVPLPATYSLYGQVTLNGFGVPNVTLVLSGAGDATTVTDGNGNYSFANVKNGSYKVAASTAYGIVSPSERLVNVSDSYVSGLNFTVTLDNAGTVIGGVTYPTGTIIGGITYPSGIVIGGITYPTVTVIGGITYPTGTVIGGIKYPNGVVIGGVSYPAGTVVGGIAFPLGAVTTNFTVPSGVVIGGITYPTGSVTGGIIYPSGTAIGTVTYPSGTVTGGTQYPAGIVVAGVVFPKGTVVGGITYPSGAVIGGVSYPTATVIGANTYPTGTVFGGITYANGVVIGGVSYPPGTVVGGITYANGVVFGGVSYPPGSVVGGITYANGVVIGGVNYPSGTVVGATTNPNGVVIGGVSYPSSNVIGGIAFPAGTITAGVTVPNGITVINSYTYPQGSVTSSVLYLDATVTGKVSNAGLTGLSGVTVTISGSDGFTTTTVTGLYGDYRLAVVASPVVDYTITPVFTGYTFTPLTQKINAVLSVIDFTGY